VYVLKCWRFNYPTINWEKLEGNNKDEEKFLDIARHFFMQYVDGPTHSFCLANL